MQKLETVQPQTEVEVYKEASFEEICPDWNDILAQNGGFMKNQNANFKTKDGKTRSIMNCPSCLVGELHGKSS